MNYKIVKITINITNLINIIFDLAIKNNNISNFIIGD